MHVQVSVSFQFVYRDDSVHVSECVYMTCVHTYMCVGILACRGQMSMSGIFLNHSPSFLFVSLIDVCLRQGLSLNLELTN